MRYQDRIPAALVLFACLLAGACGADLKEVKRTLEDDTTVGIAYRGSTITLLDTSLEARFGLGPRMAVPRAYEAVALAIRDAVRAEAPAVRVDLIDPQSELARDASDVHVDVSVDGAYLCQGGYFMPQTCTLTVQAELLVEDRRSGAVTPLDYRVARRSAEIAGSEEWASISFAEAERAVPAASLAGILADEVRRDVTRLLSERRQ